MEHFGCFLCGCRGCNPVDPGPPRIPGAWEEEHRRWVAAGKPQRNARRDERDRMAPRGRSRSRSRSRDRGGYRDDRRGYSPPREREEYYRGDYGRGRSASPRRDQRGGGAAAGGRRDDRGAGPRVSPPAAASAAPASDAAPEVAPGEGGEAQAAAGGAEPGVSAGGGGGGSVLCRNFVRGHCKHKDCKFVHPGPEELPRLRAEWGLPADGGGKPQRKRLPKPEGGDRVTGSKRARGDSDAVGGGGGGGYYNDRRDRSASQDRHKRSRRSASPDRRGRGREDDYRGGGGGYRDAPGYAPMPYAPAAPAYYDDRRRDEPRGGDRDRRDPYADRGRDYYAGAGAPVAPPYGDMPPPYAAAAPYGGGYGYDDRRRDESRGGDRDRDRDGRGGSGSSRSGGGMPAGAPVGGYYAAPPGAMGGYGGYPVMAPPHMPVGAAGAAPYDYGRSGGGGGGAYSGGVSSG
jgi:hypothetical protein